MMVKGLLRAAVCAVFLAGGLLTPGQAAEKAGGTGDDAKVLVRATHALHQQQWRQAISLYDRAINGKRLSPRTLARALLSRGLAHQQMGLHDEAITDYDAALRIDALSAGARVRALYNRALAWRAKGKPEQAIEDLTAAIYLDPDFTQGYYARGNILHERGLYYLALADYDQALKTNHPRKYLVHYAKALLYSALNSLENTKAALYAALQEKPDFQPARKRLAAIMKGRVKANRLFADLARPPAKAGKPVQARILAAGAEKGQGMKPVRVASVRVHVPASLNLRKAPQRRADLPPRAQTGMATGETLARAEEAESGAARAPVKLAQAQASKANGKTAEKARMRDMARKQDTARAQGSAGAKVAGLHTASISPAEAKGEAPARKWTGWAVQLASQRSEAAARAHWNKLKSRVKKRVRHPKLAIMKADLGRRGTFYRLRLMGFKDRKAASRACRALKRGRLSCLVVPANG